MAQEEDLRIKDLPNTKYKGFMALDDADGTGKFSVENLICSAAPVFDESVDYIAGQSVMYEGRRYSFKVNHSGEWNSNDVVLSNSLDIVAFNQLITNKGVPFAANSNFSIQNGTKHDDASVITWVEPVSTFQQNRMLAVENDGPSFGVRVAFLTANPLTLADGASIGFCEGTGLNVIFNSSSAIFNIPEDCAFVCMYTSVNNVDITKIKVYSPNFTPATTSKTLKDSHYFMQQVLINSANQVYIDTAYNFQTIRFDVSGLTEFFINYSGKFPSNFLNYCPILLTDANGYVLSKIELVGSSFEIRLKNKRVLNSFYSNAKYVYMTVPNNDEGFGFSVVTSLPIADGDKMFILLESTFHQGTFFYQGNYVSNWRLCADEYDVSGIPFVLVDHGLTISSDGPYEYLFQLNDNSYVNVWNRTGGIAKYDTKTLIPVPANAVKFIVNSSNTTTDKPYHRTRAYAFYGGTDGDTSIQDVKAERKSIDMFFIGNSLTQDAVSYLPLLLKEVCPDIEFNLYMWYNGGYTLQQQWENKIEPDVACEIFSVCHTNISWANSSVKMSGILSHVFFDYLCLQEYFNYAENYTVSDTAWFNDIIEHIASNVLCKFEVDCLFHAPKRGADFETIYQRTKAGNILILKNTPAVDIFVPGCAIYEACNTSLDSLGDLGHLSPDSTHAQEGLPCQLEAYVMLIQVLEKLGKPKTIEGVTSIVDTSNYSTINVPGPNLGSGVVVGTASQYALAKRVAAYSSNKSNAIMSETF